MGMGGMICRCLSGLVCLPVLYGCMTDGPAMEEKFVQNSDIHLSVKGDVVMSYDPLSCQILYSPSECCFSVCSDSMSDYFILRCSRLPEKEGDTVNCDVEWTTYSDVKEKKNISFTVARMDLSASTVWLWSRQSRIGAVVKML